jgi:hypothetical protein
MGWGMAFSFMVVVYSFWEGCGQFLLYFGQRQSFGGIRFNGASYARK